MKHDQVSERGVTSAHRAEGGGGEERRGWEGKGESFSPFSRASSLI